MYRTNGQQGGIMKVRLGVAALAMVMVAGCADVTTAPDAPQFNRKNVAKGETIADVALAARAATGEFSTLIAALDAAGLVGAMQAVGQRTVFAPTDAAFAELGLNAGNVATVDVALLTSILLYHVANGRRDAADVLASSQIRMLNGSFTTIDGANGRINDANIIGTNVAASNGLIHVIDKVLLP
jgi:uncharacterized surface protein with fasciclin (FAS1) repeats